MEVSFFHKPTWSSNRGGEWHRPRILRAWNRWLGPGIKPWTHKKIILQGQGIEPWTHKLIVYKASGLNPGLTKKIIRMIVHAIAKHDCAHNCKISRAYEIRADARMSSTWNVSAGWRTMARPTKKQTMDRPFQKWCNIWKDHVPCRTYLFWFTTSCTNLCTFYRLNQPATIRM